ncbi:hypothetical protein [Salinibacter ruber]|uniref:hypothetical protein n=1 Tax=Salinibacter ruber TaxID=146919 RepID=UPI002169FC22|nr:hypothetical protein [Salinibacter ruber]MCS4142528.1 hypothetical protein [Salinibacter ruber]
MIVVADTGPIIALATLDRIDLYGFQAMMSGCLPQQSKPIPSFRAKRSGVEESYRGRLNRQDLPAPPVLREISPLGPGKAGPSVEMTG